jgi:hypothetical protein
MIDWLSDRGIPFIDRLCKPELYSLIKLRKPLFRALNMYALRAERAHSVLCLSLCHSHLNPIELKWGSVKKYVARKNMSFHVDYAMKLTEEKFRIITNEDLSSRYNIVRQCE